MFNRIDKKSWRWSAGSLAGIAMLGLAALWANEAAAEKITIGALRFTSHAASFVAFERGYFKEQGFVECPVYRREDLQAGFTWEGPALVEEADSMILAHPGDRLRIDDHGVITMDV